MSREPAQKLRVLSPLHRATRQIHLYMEREIGESGLATHEGHLLTYLLSYEPSPIGELLRVFGFKRSTMTSMLDRLEDSGLLTRTPNPEDRRSWLVALTDNGREIAGGVRDIVTSFEAEVLGRLDEREMKGFERVIETIGEVTEVEVRKRG